MDRQAATKLIRDTLEQPFEKNRFVVFVKNLFNRMDTSDPFAYRGNLIRDSFEPYVSALERVGQYRDSEDKDIDILIAQLKRETSLERARTMQRNFVAWYLNGSRGGKLKDAAVVAFVSPDEADWRFSLVKMDYVMEESAAGRTKVKTELTPARRWSFLVGAGERSHTAQAQLLPLLQDDAHDPTLSRLEEAFNIETVTREFYEKYRGLFISVKQALDGLVAADPLHTEFSSKGVDTVNFAKKLLGQIVFLYFLQKKGWFGVPRDGKWGQGSKQFLRELFEKKHGDYQNFFNDILEHLFYDALRHDRSDIDHYYGRFNCRIPFLNGGLFDPLHNYDWVRTDIPLPNSLFSNTETTKEGDTGTGILDVFDRYNFTVQEDEPFEKEVALDPELLGRAYERFNAIRPDNFDDYLRALESGNKGEENRFNKEFGVYYTPREIVQYMCQESLISYLDTALNTGPVPLAAEKPVNLKLLGTPAAQQWALKTPGNVDRIPREEIEHLVRFGEAAIEHDARVETQGKETGRYRYRLPESIRWNAGMIDEKLAAVRMCDPAIGSGAFPVGLMTEIVRARDTLTTYLPDKAGRTRYAFKRNAIENSLYGVDIDPGAVEIAKLRLWLSLVVDEEDISRIEPLPNLDYRIARGDSLLTIEQDVLHWPLIDQMEALKKQYLRDSSTRKEEHKARITGLLRQIKGDSAEFNFTVDFSEVFPKEPTDSRGFDIVIANPPYIRQEKLKGRKPQLKKLFQCFDGMADIYVYFYERGCQILKNGGTLTYISSNKYFRAGYGERLRRFLGCNCRICRIIDFGDAPVFEAIAYPSIIMLKNSEPDENQVRAFTWPQQAPLEGFATIVRSRSLAVLQSELTSDGWRLESPAVLRLLEKMRRAGKPLGEYVNGRFYYGIKTGLNEAFVVDLATRDRLIAEHPSSAEVLKPFLRGRDVKRWRVEFAEQYLLFIPWHFPLHQDESISGASEQAEQEFERRYPAIYSHLLTFKAQLAARNKAETGIRYEWYALQRWAAEYWQEFERPKIVVPSITQGVEYAPDSSGFYTNDKTSICVANDVYYLLGLLNSQLLWWFIRRIAASRQGGFFEFKPMYVSQIPIPAVSDPRPIESLVGQILAARSVDPKADVSTLERQIDEIAYHLYKLTPEEIAIVEEKTKPGG